MPSFDIVVVGCGGGPLESNLSAYLLKAADSAWEKGQVIGLEAGSGMGALEGILKLEPNLFGLDPDTDKPYTAAQIYSFLRCYLISHSHLDHINSLILSAGSLGDQKRIYARKQTLKDLGTIFSDRIWPKLASYNKDDKNTALLYTPLPTDSKYVEISQGISVCSMPLTHGVTMTMLSLIASHQSRRRSTSGRLQLPRYPLPCLRSSSNVRGLSGDRTHYCTVI